MNCDVYAGLCGAFNKSAIYRCEIYSDGICHNWIERPEVLVYKCGHRKIINGMKKYLEKYSFLRKKEKKKPHDD